MNYVKEHYRDDFDSLVKQSSPKQNIINFIFKILGIEKSKYHNEFHRGVYFSSFYKNGFEFLKDEIKESELVLDERIKADKDWILNWWRKKSIKRYMKLHSENNLQYDYLWYEDLQKSEIKQYLSTTGIYLN